MTGDGSRKGRRLSSDDIALWDGVTRTVRPLRRRPQTKADYPEAGERKAGSDAPRPVPAPTAPVRASKPKKPPPLAPLDRKAKQKIARGRDSIDARLDLHGYTQAEAHDALLYFLRRIQARGGRVVLVITGKGRRGASSGESEGGVLKRAVPLWLALPDFRDLVIGYDSAAASHGGEGALYVRLRKGAQS